MVPVPYLTQSFERLSFFYDRRNTHKQKSEGQPGPFNTVISSITELPQPGSLKTQRDFAE
jgi:hypothetical protein